VTIGRPDLIDIHGVRQDKTPIESPGCSLGTAVHDFLVVFWGLSKALAGDRQYRIFKCDLNMPGIDARNVDE
jgi:hypothetical protein